MAAGKETGATLPAPISKRIGLRGAYYFPAIVQGVATSPVRCCVVCGVPVTNFNLGGQARPLPSMNCGARCAGGRRPH
jgi:hypothetical protein